MYTHSEIIKRFYDMADPGYCKFSSSLISGSKPLIGVRIPYLRVFAKEIVQNDYKSFLNNVGHDFFEEYMLEGFVISYMKIDFSSKLEFVKKFVDKIDNWSVNDSFCNSLKEFKDNRSAGYEFLEQYFNSQKEYENRFANIMLMSYYLIPEYVDRVLKVFSEFSHEAYYAKMGVAWAVATAFAKFPDKTMEFMRNWKTDSLTYNMAIRKMCESYRVSKEDKIILKNMKR